MSQKEVFEKPPEYSVRWMKESEVSDVFKIFDEVGMGGDAYTLSEEIFRCWFTKVDNKGFYIAVTDDNQILGLCAAVRQKEDLVFIGAYAVRRKYKDHGIGNAIWKTMLEGIGSRNAAINSLPDRYEECQDSGCFPVISKWSSSYWFSGAFETKNLVKTLDNVTIKEVTFDDMEDIVAYDAKIAGFVRPGVVSTILWDKETFAIVALGEEGCESSVSDDSMVDKVRKEGVVVQVTSMQKKSVCGYACIKRNMTSSAVVCPLYADSGEIAELLISRLVNNFPPAKEKGLCLMVTEKNENAMILATKMKLSHFLGMPRIWRLEELKADFSKIYGQYSLDFSVF